MQNNLILMEYVPVLNSRSPTLGTFILKKHNIFSPNSRTSEPINSMFLSLSLLHQLIDTETRGYVSDKLFNFFIDILNFNEGFSQVKQQRADNLPNISFCNTKDTVDRINALYKKMPYKLITNTIGNH